MSAAAKPGGSSEPLAQLEALDPDQDHFDRLGIARAHRVDRDALESNYLEGSRRVHPDRYVTANAGQRRRAMELASALNEAYRVIRDPVRRAEYLVKLAGIDLDSTDPRTGAPKPSQAFLVEMLERREILEEHTEGGTLDRYRDEIEGERDDVLDVAIDRLESEDVAGAAEALVRLRYLARLLDEIATEEG